jgi:hypothetical protein
VKLFNFGLSLMIIAVIALPIVAVISPSSRNFMLFAFYFCGLLELIGLIFVLVHIIQNKRNSP